MFRAILVSLGLALGLVWMVGLVDGSTTWLVWLDALVALGTFGVAALIGERTSPLLAALGPVVLGMVLGTLFVVGLVLGATSWLTWFTFAFAGGYLATGVFTFMVRAFQPRVVSRRPLGDM